MTIYYVDTSALAKYYVPETGMRWLRQLIRPSTGHVVVISYLTTIEMVSLLLRKQKTGRILPNVIQSTQDNFLKHVETRYLDAIQLMSAIDIKVNLGQPIIFLSSDKDLLVAAQSEGFSIDDPNLHP